MAESLGTAKLTVLVDDQQFQAGMAGIKAKAEGGAKAVDSITGAVRGLIPQLTALGTAAFVFDQIKKADDAAAAVRTLGVDSVELAKRLDLVSASLDYNYSRVELLQASYDIASSGFANAADATNVLRGAALAASGGFTDLNTAADGITTVLNAYGLASSDAAALADKFIQTQNDGKITVAQYGREIGGIASVAATANIGIDELNAAIAASTAKTGQVSQTFTGLRQVISSILKPSKEASDLASSLGIQYNLSGLKAKGFAGLLKEIAEKTQGSADKIAVLTGSVEAQAAIQPLLNDRLLSYNKALDNQKNSAGAASKASDENANTISGSIKKIGNEFSNLASSLDKTLTPVFSGLIKDLDVVIRKLVQVNTLNPKTVLDAQNKAFGAVESQSNPLQRTGFFGKLSVNYGGKTFTGSATGIADDITRFILQQAIDKQLKEGAGSKGTPAPAKPKEEPPQALAKIVAEKDKIVSASKEELNAAIELAAYQDRNLTQTRAIAQSRITIARAAKEAAAATENVDIARRSNDPKRLETASLALNDAGDRLKTALITGGQSAKQALIDASDRVKDAYKSYQSAQQNAFNLLTRERQQVLRDQAAASIREQVSAGVLDQSKVNAALKRGYGNYETAKPDRLFDVAGKANSIADANKELIKANRDQTKATQEQTRVTEAFNKASETLVGVLINTVANLPNSSQQPYLP